MKACEHVEEAASSHEIPYNRLAGHPPHGAEPRRQRRSRVLKDRPRGHGGLPSAIRAVEQHRPRSHGPSLSLPAGRAPKPLRPSELHQVRAARVFGREPALELREIPRIILHRRVRYGLWSLESRGYPNCRISNGCHRREFLQHIGPAIEYQLQPRICYGAFRSARRRGGPRRGPGRRRDLSEHSFLDISRRGDTWLSDARGHDRSGTRVSPLDGHQPRRCRTGTLAQAQARISAIAKTPLAFRSLPWGGQRPFRAATSRSCDVVGIESS